MKIDIAADIKLNVNFEEIKNEKIVVSESPIGMVSSVPFIARNQSGEQSSITFRAILLGISQLTNFKVTRSIP
jgi:hypothetical protein